jgi:rod shape-determining protein MreC
VSRNNVTVSILTAVVLIWVVNAIFTATRAKILDVAKPALEVSSKVSKKIKSSVPPQSKIEKENRFLYDQIDILKNKLVQLDEFRLENDRLKNLLGFKTKTSSNTISAQVIGRDPSNWTSIIYIDKGKEDGIEKYMAVTTDKGLVGRVVEVGGSTAKAMFITDPDSRIGVLVQRTRHDGLLYGTLSRQCQVVYMALDADVWPGDLIVSSGLGTSIPKGLLVGTVEDVFIDKSGLYQSAVVKPAVDLSRVEEVLCIE